MQREHSDDHSWAQDLNHEQLVNHGGDDDFTKFLEMENDFTQFGTTNQHDAPSGLDTPMGRLNFGQAGHAMSSAQQQAMLQELEMSIGSMQDHLPFSRMQQQSGLTQGDQYQHFQMYQQTPYHNQVPPTPVSAEMQAAKYAQQLDMSSQLMFDRQNAAFTPLVSPAQTPIENPWSMPDYVVADDFFSPLTSPAIEAQHHYASTNATASPIDLDPDHAMTMKKPRKKINPTSRMASARNLRAAAAGKGISSQRQDTSGANLIDHAAIEAQLQRRLLSGGVTSHAMSSEDSVSPEPQSESLMRPPPVPQARTPNALRSTSHSTSTPATPAMLMRIPGKQTETARMEQHNIEAQDVMDDIALPAAAADLPQRILPEINTQISHDDSESTPTMSAKTPKLSADSTPRSSGTRTAGNSQEILPKTGRGGRTSKKRQSISQNTISPALRPKISPSISPLVPSTSSGVPVLSAETTALYLASKSNYQNIIDGTHLPGVSYPETLAENLSSKRTSHKIAEQGRRNRINLALKEIESLLPASITAANRKDKENSKEDALDSAGKSLSGQGTSKANTVEMAIVYIKNLQSELQQTRDRLEVAEGKLAEGNSSGSQASDQTNS